jgi:WD40 repeat protein
MTSPATILCSLTGHEGDVLSVAWGTARSRCVAGVVKLLSGEHHGEANVIDEVVKEESKRGEDLNEELIATGGSDATVRVFAVTDGSCVAVLADGHFADVASVAWSGDMSRIISCSDDGSIVVWGRKDWQQIFKLMEHTSYVFQCVWSPDCSHFCSASYDKTLLIWSSQSGAVLQKLCGHDDEITSVSWSRDGKMIASGGVGHTIKLWTLLQTENKNCRKDDEMQDSNIEFVLTQTLVGHKATIKAVSFHPGNLVLASACWNCVISLWNTLSGERLVNLVAASISITSLSWCPMSGKRLLAGSGDRTIRLWETVELSN